MISRRLGLLLLALFTFSRLASLAKCAEPVKLPAPEQFELYLLIGQSNMAGRGVVDPTKNMPHPRVLKLDKNNEWAPATDPLHFDKPAVAGVGPGSGFGPAMAEAHAQATIGLIPCAVGGTPLARWQKGGDLWKQALERTALARKHGTLKGVIWHQGESDAKDKSAETYGPRLQQMIADLRAELQLPNLPVVVGQLGVRAKSDEAYQRVNQALVDLPKSVPHCACVDSTGLKFKSDNIHFDADSSREFGVRYAKAMLELQAAAK